MWTSDRPLPEPGVVPKTPHEHLRGWTVLTVATILLCCLMLAFANDWLNRDQDTLAVRRAGEPVSDVEIAQNHQHLMFWSKAALLFLLVGAVLWLCWQAQAHANLRAVGGRPRRFSRITSVLAWVVPGVSLVLPPLAILELWRGTDPEEGTVDREPWWRAALILLWWGLFVASAVLFVLAFRSAPFHGATPGELLARDGLAKNGIFVALGAGALACVLIVLIEIRLGLKETRIAYLAELAARRAGSPATS